MTDLEKALSISLFILSYPPGSDIIIYQYQFSPFYVRILISVTALGILPLLFIMHMNKDF
jgi:hypothetical protein